MKAHAPWWGVSLALHILAILLLGLATWRTDNHPVRPKIVEETRLAATWDQEAEAQDAPAADSRLFSLETKRETPPTHSPSREASDIAMPEDIRRKALLGDHWETLNPDRPDTKSAYGNEEAKIFHSVMGDVASAGGEAAWRVSLDDAIGAGSNGSSGKGGGWDVGGGTGSFGCRTGGGRTLMVKRHDGERATEAAADPPQPAAPVWTAEAVAVAKARFLAEVAGRIQKAKQYPSEARRLGAEGKVRIEFIISAGGEVLAARLAVSSGHALLDSEGLAMIHRAGPYPGIPEELGLTSIQLVLPIGFELEAER